MKIDNNSLNIHPNAVYPVSEISCLVGFGRPPPKIFVHSKMGIYGVIFIYCLPNLTKINTGTVSELVSP